MAAPHPRSAYWPELVGAMRHVSRAIARGDRSLARGLLLEAGISPEAADEFLLLQMGEPRGGRPRRRSNGAGRAPRAGHARQRPAARREQPPPEPIPLERVPARPVSELTKRELEILAAFAAGARYEEVAAQLVLSVETIKAHARSFRAKLEARNTTHAVVVAIQRGLLLRDGAA